MTDQRQTRPGGLLKAYADLKAKIGELAASGRAKAEGLSAGGAQDDPLTAGNSWEKGKKTEEVSEAEKNRSQEEMDETFGSGDGEDREARGDLPDGTATMTAEDVEAADKVEIESPDMRSGRSIGTDDNPAAPAMSTLDQQALAKMREAEDGRVPTDGLGLDDDPGVSYADDPRS